MENAKDPQNGMSILNRTFEDCQFIGPAVLAVTGPNEFSQCSFGYFGDVDSIIFECKGSKIVGTFEIKGCRFIKCDFFGISFVGNKENMDNMRASLTK
jgi:hypothetical protein